MNLRHDNLAGWAQDPLFLMGMSPLLVAAVSQNLPTKDGQYHFYEGLRKAVVATVGPNQIMLPNHVANSDKQGWQKQDQQQSSRYTPYAKGNTNKQHTQTNKTSDVAGAFDSGSKQVIGKWLDATCADCGHAGHKSKGFKNCPKHVPNAQFRRKDGKGKVKA